MSLLNTKSQRRSAAGTFTWTLSSYTNWLDAIAGNTCAATVTKSAGTDLLVEAYTEASIAVGNDFIYLGVSDGTTDYLLGTTRAFPSAGVLPIAGSVLITGLGAGSYTLTLRVKTSGARVATSESGCGAFIDVYEVNGGTVYPANAKILTPSSNLTISSSTYTDLLDGSGGSAVTTSITKALASTLLLVRETLTFVGAGSSGQIVCGVKVSGTDYDVCTCVNDSTQHSGMVGRRKITGLAAGAYTLTYRVKVTQNMNFNATSNTASISVIELPT